MRHVKKRWGREEIIFSGPYLVKRLVLDDKEHKCTSMHYHHCKTETLYVLEGTLCVEFDSPLAVFDGMVQRQEKTYADGDHIGWYIMMGPTNWLTIREGLVNAHRMTRVTDSVTYLEASTPHECDSTRVRM